MALKWCLQLNIVICYNICKSDLHVLCVENRLKITFLMRLFVNTPPLWWNLCLHTHQKVFCFFWWVATGMVGLASGRGHTCGMGRFLGFYSVAPSCFNNLSCVFVQCIVASLCSSLDIFGFSYL